ncbi:uncharacterized protein LOC125657229 [Ostrea edulis]|uniref:uncharacterized protein LOC125657229 n=1 Tax=Ostrea edulis TaxID=37623 RepID=UPI0024AF654D|nr:uncharacterized protein LOC125657229 [Ostrea edulis]
MGIANSPVFPIDNGYVSSYTATSVVYACDSGYSMVGNSVSVPLTSGWTTPGKCELTFVDKVWFWFLIGLAALLIITGLTLLCVYCYRHCFRMRSRRIKTRPKEEKTQRSNQTPRSSRGDPGCFEYGGKCDICCVDYYGCCSLSSCCGYHGFCAWFCGCCRCCREPEEGPGISSLPVSMFRKWRKKSKGGSRSVTTRPIVVIQYNRDKMRSVRKAAKTAKVPVLPLWLPHKNNVRDINTSTR